MDEHVKTEQDLSEEHLQQITGGCGDCEADKNFKMILENEAKISA